MPIWYDSSFLVEQARRKRAQAKRCRAILKDIGEGTAVRILAKYAMELEESAEVLENAWWAKRAGRDEDRGPLAEGPKFPPGRNTIH